MKSKILKDADSIFESMRENSSYLEANAESGFELEKTYSYIFDKLYKLGLSPKKCGKCGIYADIQTQNGGKLFLLRSDMDALKGIDSCHSKRVIHACGTQKH